MKMAFVALLAATVAAASDPEMARRSLVEAERAFARLSREKGIKESFLANLADDGILFRPGPVNGKAWIGERPAPPGQLLWEPARWEASAAGDLGYTTGPWEFRAKGPEDPEVRHGHYITVWRRQAEEPWKVAVDIGVSHPAGAPALAAVGDAGAGTEPAAGEKGQGDLLERDRALADAIRSQGIVVGMLGFLSDEVLLFREDRLPCVGREAARRALEDAAEPLAWRPTRAEVSRAGDLGYTYGASEGGAASFNYLRVWKRGRGGRWEVVIDVTNPSP